MEYTQNQIWELLFEKLNAIQENQLELGRALTEGKKVLNMKVPSNGK